MWIMDRIMSFMDNKDEQLRLESTRFFVSFIQYANQQLKQWLSSKYMIIPSLLARMQTDFDTKILTLNLQILELMFYRDAQGAGEI